MTPRQHEGPIFNHCTIEVVLSDEEKALWKQAHDNLTMIGTNTIEVILSPTNGASDPSSHDCKKDATQQPY